MDPVLYSNYRSLAAAVVLQACRDYIQARKYLARHNWETMLDKMDDAWMEYANGVKTGEDQIRINRLRINYYNAKKNWYRYCNMQNTIDTIEYDFEYSYLYKYLTFLGLDISTETIVENLTKRGDQISTIINGFTYKQFGKEKQ